VGEEKIAYVINLFFKSLTHSSSAHADDKSIKHLKKIDIVHFRVAKNGVNF